MKKPKLYFTRGELDRDKDGLPLKAKRKAVRRFSGKADDRGTPVREKDAAVSVVYQLEDMKKTAGEKVPAVKPRKSRLKLRNEMRAAKAARNI